MAQQQSPENNNQDKRSFIETSRSLGARFNKFIKNFSNAFCNDDIVSGEEFRESSKVEDSEQSEQSDKSSDSTAYSEYIEAEVVDNFDTTHNNNFEDLFSSCSLEEALTFRIVKNNDVAILEELLDEYETKNSLQKLKLLFKDNKQLAIWVSQHADAHLIRRIPLSILKLIQEALAS